MGCLTHFGWNSIKLIGIVKTSLLKQRAYAAERPIICLHIASSILQQFAAYFRIRRS